MNLDKDPFDILDEIDKLPDYTKLSYDDWNMLELLKNHYDYEIRLYLCEVLSHFHCQRSENILIHLLNDTENLVVASACDSLSYSKSSVVLKELKKHVNSRNYIVRGYAYMSIGEIINRKSSFLDNIEFLIISIEKEKSIWVKAGIAYALCLNGFSTEYLIYIEKLLFNVFYNYRLFALNLLTELFKFCSIDKYKKQITKKLVFMRQNDKNSIVVKKIDSLLDSIGGR